MKKNKLYSLLLALVFVVSATMGAVLTGCKPEEEPPKPEDAKVIGITLDTSAVKTVFAFGEPFTYEGLKVTAQMSDNTTKDINPDDCRINTPNMETPGKRNVAVAYEGQTDRYQITIEKKKIPEISATSLLDIVGENDSVAYRVEAENINMEISGTKLAEGKTSFVADAPEDAEITGGGKYLTNYGVKWNYFGFTFTADKAYSGVTLVFRLANSGTANIDLAENLNVYLNYNDEGETVEGQLNAIGTITSGVCQWTDVCVRNVNLVEGVNKLTFEALSDTVPDIDYIDFYVGMRYISSIAELSEVGTLMKDLETFDTEYASTRKDWADANPDKIVNGLGLEVVTKESEGKTTSGGKSIAALNAGSQLSTTIRVAKDSTVTLYFIATHTAPYVVKNMWEFYIDGIKLEMVEDADCGISNASTGEYWNWYPTNLGTYNLAEGDHLFLVKNVGGACNIDGVQFDVISSGEYDESGVDLDKQTPVGPVDPDPKDTVTINGSGTYIVEAEDLDSSDWVMKPDLIAAGRTSFVENWSNDFGSGACACGFLDATFTIQVKVEKAATLQLSVRMSHYDNDTYDFSHTTFTFAGQTLTPVPESDFGHRADDDFWKWVEVALGSVAVEPGEYEFKMVTNGNINVDRFCFVDGSEPVNPYDLTIGGKGEYKIETEDLDQSTWLMRDDLAAAGHTFTEPWNNDFGSGVCAKGFKGGTVISAKVKVNEAATLALSMRMSYYDGNTYDFSAWTITFAGKTLTPVPAGEFGHREAQDYWKWVEVALGTVTVEPGTYEFKIEMGNGGVNLDYFKFVNAFAVGAGNTKIEAETLDTSKIVLQEGVPSCIEGDTKNPNNQCLRGIMTGSVISFTFVLTEDSEVSISALMSKYESDYSTEGKFTVTLNGEAISVENVLLGRAEDGSNDWHNWKSVGLGEKQVLKAGTYTITLTATSMMPNVDCFILNVTPQA